MFTHRTSATFLKVAIVLVGALVGGLASGSYASALPHPCQENECNEFLIFWEHCEANPDQDTFCGNDAGEKGCYTGGCGHK